MDVISVNKVDPCNYDDIGNRTTAEGKTYTANNLNQYTAIDDFVPQYDDDGNQTLIKTETGIWSVLYNAENRPIRWQSGGTVITMSFDRMGRRVEMRTQSAASDTLQRFVYDNYLCIQQLRTPSNALFQSYIWDPTEPIATRPLVFQPASGEIAHYFHDGNKNVSDLVPLSEAVVHYAYTPFGSSSLSVSTGNNMPANGNEAGNPYRFSSEVYDAPLALSYYNYREYQHLQGRWSTRDPLESFDQVCLYGFCRNSISVFDYLGLARGRLSPGIRMRISPKPRESPENIKGLQEKFNPKESVPSHGVESLMGILQALLGPEQTPEQEAMAGEKDACEAARQAYLEKYPGSCVQCCTVLYDGLANPSSDYGVRYKLTALVSPCPCDTQEKRDKELGGVWPSSPLGANRFRQYRGM